MNESSCVDSPWNHATFILLMDISPNWQTIEVFVSLLTILYCFSRVSISKFSLSESRKTSYFNFSRTYIYIFKGTFWMYKNKKTEVVSFFLWPALSFEVADFYKKMYPWGISFTFPINNIIYCARAIITRSWLQTLHKDRIFWKNLLENKEMVFKMG